MTLTRRLIKKELRDSYIYIGLSNAKYFPEPDEEFTILIEGKEFKARTYDWHCACRCPNPVHTHRCIDARNFRHLLPEDRSKIVIKKVRDGVFELEVVGQEI